MKLTHDLIAADTTRMIGSTSSSATLNRFAASNAPVVISQATVATFNGRAITLIASLTPVLMTSSHKVVNFAANLEILSPPIPFKDVTNFDTCVMNFDIPVLPSPIILASGLQDANFLTASSIRDITLLNNFDAFVAIDVLALPATLVTAFAASSTFDAVFGAILEKIFFPLVKVDETFSAAFTKGDLIRFPRASTPRFANPPTR